MKKFLLLLWLSLPLALHAEIHQVTALNTSSAKVIITPGMKVTYIVIENIGANAVNISVDGGSANGGTDPTTGSTGLGLVLPAAANGVPGIITIYAPTSQGVSITGIMQTSTTTLNVITNAPAGTSTFPTN